MKHITKQIMILGLVTAGLMASADAVSAVVVLPFPCSLDGATGKMKALGRSSLYTAHRDFSGGIESGVPYPAGTFGPEPLFKTSFTVGGTSPSCVVATLSVNAQPNDNGMVFQARVDGIPMGGQWSPSDFLAGTGNIPNSFNVPIVWLPNVVDQPGPFAGIDPPHMASYTFFANVSPGSHQIDLRVAGCCHEDIDVPASTPDGFIRSATLAIQHR